MPKKSKLTDAMLTDRLGAVRAQIKELQAEEKLLKEDVLARGKSGVAGKHWVTFITSVTQARLDAEKVRAFLTPRAIAECTVETRFSRVDTVSVEVQNAREAEAEAKERRQKAVSRH